MLSRVLGLVVAAALALGCGASSNGGGNPSLGSASPSCESGLSCNCNSGKSSLTVCDEQGQQTCDCPSCPAFAPGKSGFKSCGGADGVAAALYGTWELKSHDLSELQAFFDYSDVLGTNASGTCDSEAQELTKPSMTLILEDGGNASVHWMDDAISYSVLESCVAAAVPVDCATFKTCQVTACGLCECTTTLGGVANDAATWSTTGSTLLLNELSDLQATFDYCLEGDQLTLQDSHSKEVLVLTRTAKLGTPSACATRSAKRCENDGACHLGACVGTGCPTIESEAACTNQAGCTWNSSACSGTPKAECAVADYGLVPGCGKSTIPPYCVGHAQPCSDSRGSQCTARAGCDPVPGCTGTFTTDCTKDVLDCGSCAPGCTCTQDTFEFHCTGVSRCADQTTPTACQDMTCEWIDANTCEGTPPSCDSLSAVACVGSPGCALSTD